jgi:Protein of unknown function (DUF5131)
MNHRVPPDDFDTFEAACRAADAKRNGNAANHDNHVSGKAWNDGLITARELQSKTFRPVRIILPGLMPEGVTLLAGKPKVGKSWLARAQGRRRRVFCASLADVFDNQAPNTWRADLFRLIRDTPELDWQLLTKRPQNIVRKLPTDWGEAIPTPGSASQPKTPSTFGCAGRCSRASRPRFIS